MRAALCKAGPRSPAHLRLEGEIKDHRVCHQTGRRGRPGQWEPRPPGAGSKGRAPKGSGRGPLITARGLRPAARRGESRVLKANGLRPAEAPGPPPPPVPDKLAPFISLPFFPPLPRPPARQTGLWGFPALADPPSPLPRVPPRQRELKGTPRRPQRRDTGSPSRRPGAGEAPVEPQPPEGLPETVGDPLWPWSCRAQRFFFNF